MGLRVAVQQQDRRPAAPGHQVDLGARGRDPAALKTGKNSVVSALLCPERPQGPAPP
jgi:hypothetical protein